MCMIIASTDGRRRIDSADVQYSQSVNPDGWGIAFSDGERVHVQKGLAPTAFWTAYNATPADLPIVVHFRFATHGRTTRRLCHPFPIGRGMFLAHNGICQHGELTKKESDTSWLARMIVKPMAIHHGMTVQQVADVLERIEPGSRWAVIDPQGNIGIGNEDDGYTQDGVWFSGCPFPVKVRRWTKKGSTILFSAAADRTPLNSDDPWIDDSEYDGYHLAGGV